jgi:hypothetical protein
LLPLIVVTGCKLTRRANFKGMEPSQTERDCPEHGLVVPYIIEMLGITRIDRQMGRKMQPLDDRLRSNDPLSNLWLLSVMG